jgi:hypothetical protein
LALGQPFVRGTLVNQHFSRRGAVETGHQRCRVPFGPFGCVVAEVALKRKKERGNTAETRNISRSGIGYRSTHKQL